MAANTIIDGSSGANCATSNGGTITDGGNNLSDDGTCGFSGDNTNALLDPAGLQNNGGPTKTIALQSLSPALDAYNNNGCGTTIATDQRGILRPQATRSFLC